MENVYLGIVCHNIQSNTLEATWFQKTDVEILRVKCRNYSAEQKNEFLADCGEQNQKYVDMANW
jgi:hypothetical protein